MKKCRMWSIVGMGLLSAGFLPLGAAGGPCSTPGDTAWDDLGVGDGPGD